MSDLRVGVPADLLGLPAHGGHGKVWNRVLGHLAERAKVVPLGGIRGRRPDVVLASGHAPLPRTRGAPLVVEVHEAAWFDPELRAMLGDAFLAEIERNTEAAVRAADHVITISHAAARDVARDYRLDPARVHGVPLGADAVFHPGARADAAPAGPYVVYVGVIHPRKNLAALRAAMATLAAEGLPHGLVVVGSPAADRQDGSELMRAAAAELPGAPGRVTFLEGLDDGELAGVMAAADALCLPSFYEGFAIPVLEAMACGTPAVVSDRGALPEVVGDAGVVVAPEPDAVTAGLRRLLTEPGLAERLGAAARERAREFTWERTADGWLSALRTAAEAH